MVVEASVPRWLAARLRAGSSADRRIPPRSLTVASQSGFLDSRRCVRAELPRAREAGMSRTGFAVRGFDPEKAIEELNASVPVGHIASPEEIVDVMLFLASDAARYMCGALVEVNGGKPVT